MTADATLHPGAEIRRARLAAGLSMRGLAEKVGVSAATVCAIEKGTTGLTVGRLHAIAAALDMAPGRFLTPIDVCRESAPRYHPKASWREFPALAIDSVLDGAIECFVDTGYHGSSMRELAARIGVGVSSIYHHYADKQQLLVSILNVTMSELAWRVDAARAEATDSCHEVALIVEALALFHTHHRKLAFIGASEMRSLEDPNRRRITRARDRLQYILDQAIDQALLDGFLDTPYPRSAGRAIATMCTSLPQWFRVSGPLAPEEIARAYVAFALSMLGAAEPR